jgi:hypothetical protein
MLVEWLVGLHTFFDAPKLKFACAMVRMRDGAHARSRTSHCKHYGVTSFHDHLLFGIIYFDQISGVLTRNVKDSLFYIVFECLHHLKILGTFHATACKTAIFTLHMYLFDLSSNITVCNFSAFLSKLAHAQSRGLMKLEVNLNANAQLQSSNHRWLKQSVCIQIHFTKKCCEIT